MYGTAMLTRNSKVELTPAGKDMHDAGRFDGSTAQDILVFLNDTGGARIFNIADQINESDQATINAVNGLLKGGYVKIVGDNEIASVYETEENSEDEEF